MKMKFYGGESRTGEPIDQYLDREIFQGKEGGVFVELGGYDGQFYSNTLFFEEERKWTGILIEPSPAYFECAKRRDALVFHYACVDDPSIKSLVGHFPGTPVDALNTSTVRKKGTNEIPTTTLSKILDRCNMQEIDFLSLDVEGVELQVLRGMGEYRPKYILIETFGMSVKQINDWMVGAGYSYLENLTEFNRKKNPTWDGTHQDFLWKYTPEIKLEARKRGDERCFLVY